MLFQIGAETRVFIGPTREAMGLENLPEKVEDKYYNRFNRNSRRYLTTQMGVTSAVIWCMTMNPNRLVDLWGHPSLYYSSHWDDDAVLALLNELLQVLVGMALNHLADKKRNDRQSKSIESVDLLITFGRAMVAAQSQGSLPAAMEPMTNSMLLCDFCFCILYSGYIAMLFVFYYTT